MTYPTSATICAHGPWWLYCGEPVRVREEDGRAWVLLKGGWVYVPSTDGSSWGGPVRLQPGDLVTGADAPEGAPSWLGKVVATNAGAFSDVSIQILGSSTNWARAPVTVRPITDLEAVGLAEALTWERWEVIDMWYDGPVASHVLQVGDVIAASTILSPFDDAGGWHVLHRRKCIAAGDEEQEPGKVAASRALLRWMCEGSRGVDEACVS